MVKTFGWVAGGCLALVVSGCGGTSDDADASCGDTSACGGDIAGNWKITSSCLEWDATEVSEGMGCAGVESKAKDIAMSGTVAYNGDKTYRANITVTGSVVVTVPAACLTQQGVTLTCAQVQQSLETSATDNGYESVACSGSSGCSCTMKLIPQTEVTDGTYSTSGGTLQQAQAGGTPDDSSYCVKGNALTLSPDGMSEVTGSIVLTKQ